MKIDVKKYQSFQLKALKELHRVCIKYGIKYYMIGGTLLGAVRHKGFIPWDIDIDVAMLRDDYERFAESCKLDLDKRFFYQSYKTEKDYYAPHAKICINNTEIVLKNKRIYNHLRFHKGIYIDIFPLDKVPISKNDITKQKRTLIILDKIKYHRLGSIFNLGFCGYKYIIKKLIRLMLLILPLNWLNRLQDQTMQMYENNTSLLFVSSMSSHYGYDKQVMSKEVYGEPKLLEFEGGYFYAPEKTHEYLEQIYGNYMELPPLDKRNAQIDIYNDIIYDK